MGCVRILAALLMAITLMLPGQAMAQELAKSFAVLPFTINGPDKYQYLSRGIQDMMISRLNWDKHLEPVGKDRIAASVSNAPESDAAAVRTLEGLDADYLVWGSVTILGEQCSVDLRVNGKDGSAWPQDMQTDIGGLIPALEGMARQVNDRIFKRPDERKVAAEDKPVNRMNPELIFNERKDGQQFYLNPQFRYSGGSDTPGRWKSPRLPFTAQGMIAGDPDGDGLNELIFISKHSVHVYRWQEGRLLLLDEITPSQRIELLNVDLIDLDRDGHMEIAVSGVFEQKLDSALSRNAPHTPNSYIFAFEDGHLKPLAEDLNFFMRVVRMPPNFSPVLLGQKAGRLRIFDSPVHEVVRMGGEYQLGKRVALPEKANVFNVTYLPTNDGYKLLLVSKDDHIEVYTPGNELQSTTLDQFAGSQLGFEIPDTLTGLGTAKDQYTNLYYIPLRLVPTNLDGNENWEVLVNKNISVAAQFFERYRFFPNGEIHSLFWDGVGMSLAWKTRRIKGTVCDYGLADIDNDGVEDLYVALNTYPGNAGLGERKAMVVSYSLDRTKTDENSPVEREQ
ncbi:hypothetical protein GGQ74_001692 [Desulfobaculum xiamenense]|uniref:VCBS repeat-containing protein n=1 Tax=Desulfobaculum xiamenense TaxID=995050 RepID=A0A846QTQ7_9BACT|nr:VCBS repeat-containing protein [Desulfobaculum xiamenense]NJB68019.1 hypothetical protein [Desulfobaculum xiamenense]